MPRLWRQIIKGEEGQALPIVLILLIVGGLIIAPTLNHVSTSLKAGRIVEENVKGIYAAEAGVEEALWYLTQQLPESIPEQLPEDVNQMEVEIDPDPMGIYALYFGEILEITEQHPDWLAVAGEMVWIEEEDAYQYTITVTWQPYPGEPDIKLADIGVRLPIGYNYVEYSAADFSEYNLFDDDEPGDLDATDWAGAQMLSWEFANGEPPKLNLDNQTATQTFYVTGEGRQEGDYTWAKSPTGEGIGEVSEVMGTLYKITSTATSDSGSSTTIEAYVLVGGDVTIVNGSFQLGEGDPPHYGNVYYNGNVQLEAVDATIYGDAYAETGNVQLKEAGATINGTVCAGGDVQLEAVGTEIRGNVYAGGNVQLSEGATIYGNVYAGGDVQRDPGATITGDIDDDYDYDSEGCGLSLTGNRLQILNWEID